MDRFEASAQIIVQLNQYKDGNVPEYEFISSVCDYFDQIKDETLHQSDYKFLRYLADSSGIPHFYNILSNFNHDIEIYNFDLNTFSSVFYESTLHTDEKSMLHKYQKQILNRFEKGKPNRFILSASTSFGKTHLVFEIIKKMSYKNVVLVFPTIALLSEILERIYSDKKYEYFKENYLIHTLSDVQEIGDKNLHIYTPERYLSYVEKITKITDFDFVFIDEVYKIDNEFLIDEIIRENERDLAYRLAVSQLLIGKADALLAGPYMDFEKKDSHNYNGSFNAFLEDCKITSLDYNNYEIVSKSYFSLVKNKIVPNLETKKQLDIEISTKNLSQKLIDIVKSLCFSRNENLIIYCSSRGKRSGVEFFAEKLIDSIIFSENDYSEYSKIVNHISSKFPNDWILLKALKHGIGIHHGLIPKYIQKEIINLFNLGLIKVLISTTTITEGVNTSAKNLVVMKSFKGNKQLKKFDAKNIAGRAGRFGFHYSGCVIDLSNEFYQILEGKAEPIKHKNYDLNSIKDDVDLFCSKEQYLSKDDIIRKSDIDAKQESRKIPETIMSQFKVISRNDKITIYDNILNLSAKGFKDVENFINAFNRNSSIDLDGLQVIVDTIKPIVSNMELLSLINVRKFNKRMNKDYSILSLLIVAYIIGGFMGSINYKISNQGKKTDSAISETAKFIYNTLKYQVVKYFGAFNLLYKYIISVKNSIPIDNVKGIDKLLLRFEYNALTNEGRIASDYGVPSSIVEYYEKGRKQEIRDSFDEYEYESFKRIDNIINNVS